VAAIDKDGKEHTASSSHTTRCTALNAKGLPCGAWALRGEDVCQWHSLSPEEQQAQTQRAGRARAQQRRERAELRDASRNRPEAPRMTLQQAIDVIDALLDATIPGLGEPDFELRALGVYALAQLFRVRDRTEILDLLARVRPKLVADPQRDRLLDYQAARERLRQVYREGRVSIEELPPDLIGLTAA
jgi:hypothetical protein